MEGPAVHLPGSQQEGHCRAEDRGQRNPSAPRPRPAPPHGAPETSFPLASAAPSVWRAGFWLCLPALAPAAVGACHQHPPQVAGWVDTLCPRERSREAQAECGGPLELSLHPTTFTGRWTQPQLCCPAVWPGPSALPWLGLVGWPHVGGINKVTWVCPDEQGRRQTCLPSSHSETPTGEAGGPAMEGEGRPERSAGPGQRGPSGCLFLGCRVPWAAQQRPWGEICMLGQWP